MASIDSIVTEYVKCYESNNEAGEGHYCTGVRAAGGLNVQGLSRQDVENVVRPFLYKWGHMGGHPLGWRKFANWMESLANAVSNHATLLKKYAAMELADADLAPERQDIATLYDSFKDAVSQVAAAKCLHLFAPRFFPMWDTAIAQAARKERNASHLEQFSTEDYCQFVEQVQTFIKGNSHVISRLAAKYGKTSVKIADEVFFWCATQRPLYSVLSHNLERTKYTVALRRTDEGFSVSCPGLPGCWSQGDTEEEAIENIKDAIREYLAAVYESVKDAETREVEVVV